MVVKGIRGENRGGRDASRHYDKRMVVKGIRGENRGGRDASRPYDKRMIVKEMKRRSYDKWVEITEMWRCDY